MDFTEFQQIDFEFRKLKPKLFLLVPSDRPADPEEIRLISRTLGVTLPRRYHDFLEFYGGGIFGLVNIFSADLDSDFFLLRKVEETSNYLPSGLLPFSDDYCGGLYVLRVREGDVEDAVYYWNSDGGLMNTTYGDILEFIVDAAYGPK